MNHAHSPEELQAKEGSNVKTFEGLRRNEAEPGIKRKEEIMSWVI